MQDQYLPPAAASAAVWVRRLGLTCFRNYASLSLRLDARPVVLTGPNGAGKTNLLEAVSLLAPGQGMRRTPYPELVHDHRKEGRWAISAELATRDGPVQIGTGMAASSGGREGGSRVVRINRETQRGSGVLADLLDVLWLTPAMDGLFTGPASDRRRFLDRLIVCFDPGYRSRLGLFERAMRQRNRLLEAEYASAAQFESLEVQMAEAGVAIAAARLEAISAMERTIDLRRQTKPDSPFPWARLEIEGRLEGHLADAAAVDVEDAYLELLRRGRARDRAARRTLEGPHRSELVVTHGPKAAPAKQCSTGEQKALLINLVLAHAELVKEQRGGIAPILLLDEIAAHLDPLRRAALFGEIVDLGTQAWMTGTDVSAFRALADNAQFFAVEDAEITQ